MLFSQAQTCSCLFTLHSKLVLPFSGSMFVIVVFVGVDLKQKFNKAHKVLH